VDSGASSGEDGEDAMDVYWARYDA